MMVATLALVSMASGVDANTRPHPVIYVTLVTGGVIAYIHKLAAVADVSASAFLMMQSGTAHLTAHAVVLRRGGYHWARSTIQFALLTGSIIGVAMLLGVYALRHAEALVIAPILQLGFLVSAPLSFLVIGEPVTARKLFGLLLGAAAIGAFALEL